jgi:hypothetical protein
MTNLTVQKLRDECSARDLIAGDAPMEDVMAAFAAGSFETVGEFGEWLEARPHLIAATAAAKKKSINPWLAEGWNLSAQGAMLKSDPALAADFAKRARSYIGATKPTPDGQQARPRLRAFKRGESQ